MSGLLKTPSPPQSTPAVPTNTPATPGASTSPDTVPGTPRSRALTGAPQTPGTTISPVAHTPGGSRLVPCTSDPKKMKVITAHTAKCQDCELRAVREDMHPVLQCPGCPSFKICNKCRGKRVAAGKTLTHGMLTPSGLGLGLGSGVSKRRGLPGINSPVPSPLFRKEDSVSRDVKMASPGHENPEKVKGKGKGKEKAAPAPAPVPTTKVTGKKRAAKSKPSRLALQDASSGDDFMPDPGSPTSHKRRRTALTITDTPTATSARPSRTTPATSTHPTYVAPFSPDGSITSSDLATSEGTRPAMLNTMERRQQWNVNIAPPSRIQELLEQAGVNTPENRYEEHLMTTRQPIMSSSTILIPETVKHMADPTPRLTAEQKVDARNKAAIESGHALAQSHMVRSVALSQASKYRSTSLSADENEELAHAITRSARIWAGNTFRKLPENIQGTVDKGLDMRLDHIEPEFREELEKTIERCAMRKTKQFENERAVMEGVGREGDAVKDS
ncbi:hypothetical protein CC86DRAFT_419164 [Ophiobolus disseminans]|uniref:Uncharacterized protein n=1 Tax=Ophiobolus disseminans TaxID=1469910 RepID=A0A6A6ZY84_9PLEO|nr:hypothetical protein CC86DRAFT_419164 [Ophiobolus disseminans]